MPLLPCDRGRVPADAPLHDRPCHDGDAFYVIASIECLPFLVNRVSARVNPAMIAYPCHLLSSNDRVTGPCARADSHGLDVASSRRNRRGSSQGYADRARFLQERGPGLNKEGSTT